MRTTLLNTVQFNITCHILTRSLIPQQTNQYHHMIVPSFRHMWQCMVYERSQLTIELEDLETLGGLFQHPLTMKIEGINNKMLLNVSVLNLI